MCGCGAAAGVGAGVGVLGGNGSAGVGVMGGGDMTSVGGAGVGGLETGSRVFRGSICASSSVAGEEGRDGGAVVARTAGGIPKNAIADCRGAMTGAGIKIVGAGDRRTLSRASFIARVEAVSASVGSVGITWLELAPGSFERPSSWT